jgi:hypothetical protein
MRFFRKMQRILFSSLVGLFSSVTFFCLHPAIFTLSWEDEMYIIVNNTPLGKTRALFLLWRGHLLKKLAAESKMQKFENRRLIQCSANCVPPQSIGCAAPSYQVCRHKVSGVLPQVIWCATTKYRVCCHKLSGVPSQCIRSAATSNQVCRRNVLGVLPQVIRCATT